MTAAQGQDAPPPNPYAPDQLEYQRRLNEVLRRVHDAGSFDDALPALEAEILTLLGAERMTVFQKGRRHQEIVSRFKSGDEVQEIRVPVGPTSIAGYVALTKEGVLIQDVYDDHELRTISPHLRFNRAFDQASGFRTRSMVVEPIVSNDVLLGVLQVLNRRDGESFDETDQARVQDIARIIGQKYRYDLRGTRDPFEHLLNRGHLTAERLAELQEQARREGRAVADILVEDERLEPAVVGESLEHYYQVRFLGYDADRDLPDATINQFKRSYLRTNRVVPVAQEGDSITLLIDDPNDTTRIMELQSFLGGYNFDIRVGLPSDILRYLCDKKQPAGSDKGLADLIGQLGEEQVTAGTDGDEVEGEEVDENEATVVQLVNKLIVDAYNTGASDIHVEPAKGNHPADVRMRIDGECRQVLEIPASHINPVIARIKIMARLDIAERRKPQDGKISVRLQGQPVELRVATVPTVNGESAVLRLLASGGPLPFDKLNLGDRNHRETQKILAQPHGLFLVVGPTGSGKTTSLHGVLGELNEPNRKIWTAEDPVEITQPGLQQVQVHPKIGFDFAAALRSFLRADPDIILIGEIRDQETAESAVEASLTGHMVLSTLHTNSAAETVTRLLDLGLDPMNFADALLGILAQRLVRTLCATCKEPYTPNEDEFAHLVHIYGEEDFPELGFERTSTTLYRPVGCTKCGNTGYRGRTGVHELLVGTGEMQKLVAKSPTIADIRDLAYSEGMRTLLQDGVMKIFKGQTDLNQLRKVAAE